MPFSDNPYSADDSDVDSFSDELSPTDGYFNPNRGAAGIRPGMMVQDPSIGLDDKKPEAKVLIPTPHAQAPMRQGERASNHPAMAQSSSSASYASPPPSENSPASPENRHTHNPLSRLSPQHHDHVFAEQMPLMSGPPPAYTPSPDTPHAAVELSASERSYRTFAENHLERGLLEPHQPESMGGHVEDEADERAPLSNNTLTKIPRWRRVNKRVLLLALLSTVIIIWVVAACPEYLVSTGVPNITRSILSSLFTHLLGYVSWTVLRRSSISRDKSTEATGSGYGDTISLLAPWLNLLGG